MMPPKSSILKLRNNLQKLSHSACLLSPAAMASCHSLLLPPFMNNIYIITANTDFNINNLIEKATHSHCLAHIWVLLEFAKRTE